MLMKIYKGLLPLIQNFTSLRKPMNRPKKKFLLVRGNFLAKEFRDRGLKPENLSRTLEDSGTVTSVLFPWNTCGAAQASVLGVATGTYWMYCFFNLLSPLMTVFYAYMNIKIKRFTPEEMEEIAKKDVVEEN